MKKPVQAKSAKPTSQQKQIVKFLWENQSMNEEKLKTLMQLRGDVHETLDHLYRTFGFIVPSRKVTRHILQGQMRVGIGEGELMWGVSDRGWYLLRDVIYLKEYQATTGRSPQVKERGQRTFTRQYLKWIKAKMGSVKG